MANLRSTLCWYCQNAVPDAYGNGCSWSRKLHPVDGWRATERTLMYDYKPKVSYIVHWCPEYKREGRT